MLETKSSCFLIRCHTSPVLLSQCGEIVSISFDLISDRQWSIFCHRVCFLWSHVSVSPATALKRYDFFFIVKFIAKGWN